MTETREDTLTWLTQEAFDRLKAEHDYLSGPGRIEIAKKIEAAREEGDLKENGGYHAAKDEQGMRELRIRQLAQILENSRVGDAPRADGVVGPLKWIRAKVEELGKTQRNERLLPDIEALFALQLHYFLLLHLRDATRAKAYVAALREQNIYIKGPWAAPWDPYATITVGPIEVMDRFVEATRAFCSSGGPA